MTHFQIYNRDITNMCDAVLNQVWYGTKPSSRVAALSHRCCVMNVCTYPPLCCWQAKRRDRSDYRIITTVLFIPPIGMNYMAGMLLLLYCMNQPASMSMMPPALPALTLPSNARRPPSTSLTDWLTRNPALINLWATVLDSLDSTTIDYSTMLERQSLQLHEIVFSSGNQIIVTIV